MQILLSQLRIEPSMKSKENFFFFYIIVEKNEEREKCHLSFHFINLSYYYCNRKSALLKVREQIAVCSLSF